MTVGNIQFWGLVIGVVLAVITVIIRIKSGPSPARNLFCLLTILDFLGTCLVPKTADIIGAYLNQSKPSIEEESQDGYTLVTLVDNHKFNLCQIYYHIDEEEDILYEEPFPVGDSCTVTAYSKFLFVQSDPVSKTFVGEVGNSIRAEYTATLGPVGTVQLEIKIPADAIDTSSMFGLGNGSIYFDENNIQISGMGPAKLLLQDSDFATLLAYHTNDALQTTRQDTQGSSGLNSIGDRVFIDTPEGTIIMAKDALRELLGLAGSVSISMKKVYRNITFSIISGDKRIDSVSGGVVLSMEGFECGPGTIAALNNSGKLLTIQKSVVNTDHTVIPLDGSANIEIFDNSKIFSDISDAKWAEDAIAFVTSHELFNPDFNKFLPNNSMTRAAMTNILYNLAGRPKESFKSSFKDVSDQNWYAESAYWAKDHGIILDNDGLFNADDLLPREQFIVMLWRYAGSPDSQTNDLDYGDFHETSVYARSAMLWAAETKIIGVNDAFRPKHTITRAEAAQIVKRYCEMYAVSSITR